MSQKINLFALLLIACGISACGKSPSDPTTPIVDVGNYASYVSRFEAASQSVGKPVTVTNLIIRDGAMESPYENGACVIANGQTPTITIKASAWALLTEPERESLIFHELGHCILGRAHNNNVNGSGDPVSLMNPYPIGPQTYSANRDGYIVELFQ